MVVFHGPVRLHVGSDNIGPGVAVPVAVGSGVGVVVAFDSGVGASPPGALRQLRVFSSGVLPDVEPSAIAGGPTQ